MSLKDCKDIAEAAMRIMRVLQGMSPQRQLEVMAVAQTMANVEAGRSLAQQQRPMEVRDE